eukprot:5851358-Prymnesium_polylepis.1
MWPSFRNLYCCAASARDAVVPSPLSRCRMVPAGVVARSAAAKYGGEHIVVPLPVMRRINVHV